MWKIIVTWCILQMTPVMQEPQYDEFGRKIPNVTLGYNCKTDSICGYYKSFDTWDDAKLFYNKALNEPGITNVKIDSLFLVVRE